jgi:ketopantoate hydroxymethyltransferase
MEKRRKTTLSTLVEMKRSWKPISVLTAYDFPTAQIEETAGVDCILVGDSAAQVVHQGRSPAQGSRTACYFEAEGFVVSTTSFSRSMK